MVVLWGHGIPTTTSNSGHCMQMPSRVSGLCAAPVRMLSAVPTGNNLGAMVGRVQSAFLVGPRILYPACCALQSCALQSYALRSASCTIYSSCPCTTAGPRSQFGTLSLPQMPDSYRAGSSQLSWVAMDYRWGQWLDGAFVPRIKGSGDPSFSRRATSDCCIQQPETKHLHALCPRSIPGAGTPQPDAAAKQQQEEALRRLQSGEQRVQVCLPGWCGRAAALPSYRPH